jgi:ketosteroid isomerase-like protein
MPGENVETVRNAFEAWGRGDLAALTDLIDPNVHWSWWEPGPWDCHGRDQVLQVMQERDREGVKGELTEVLGAGDKVVIGVAGRDLERFFGEGQDHVYNVFTFRDGKVIGMQDFRTRAEALAAAGLPDRSIE